MTSTLSWCDAHLDLAYLELSGRDMTGPLEDATGGPQPPAITLPSLSEGGVRWVFATLFTGRGDKGVGGYADPEGARRSAIEQLDVYRRWEEQGLITLVHSAKDLEAEGDALRIVLLMEGGDPIADPDDAAWWYEQGVRLVGLTWASGSRYAGGNRKPGPLSEEGREMVKALDEAGLIHDVSHLADAACDELLDLASGPAIASHSNSRALVGDDNQRHLPDEFIRRIGERGGVVGLNLCTAFIVTDDRRATIDETAAHVARAAQIMGRRDGVGLGSDMDGGFGAHFLPQGISAPSDLIKIAGGLEALGWSDSEVEGFASNNWLILLRQTLNLVMPQSRSPTQG